MLLIATDEAGYGPKLGPFVVAATAWRLDDHAWKAAQDAFGPYREPIQIDSSRVLIDDSKAVFQPASRTSSNLLQADHRRPPYHVLQWVTSAGWRCVHPERSFLDLTKELASLDHQSLSCRPWLQTLTDQTLEIEDSDTIVRHWRHAGAQLIGIRTRVIDAGRFNALCDAGLNKSDILGDLTLRLTRDFLESDLCTDDEPVEVFCDRHGGRRYYAGPLQAAFDGTLVQVVEESKRESHYRVPFADREFGIRFTVKGDSFTPVAFSSMVAKFLREKSMESFNRYFREQHVGLESLRPTAGYPVDADRFLDDIDETVRRLGIIPHELIRCR
ncbi:hypothetical protein [Roseiconus lacunae]|uniref:hypothetical protein n=1 Tax=Roseiconus lacunae TaxID=2605694 RepID=UPI0011F36C95|nr:hypothetical protein [Roseiconus lacunae]